MQRRNFITYLAAVSAAIASVPRKLMAASKEECFTDADVQGPFHRMGAPERSNLAEDYSGKGRLLEVRGTVYSGDCSTPIANAKIDLWHAGPDGQYDERSDKFIFRGIVKTNEQGQYFFKTLIPAGYRDGGLDRPAHLHYIVTADKHHRLVTQLYFKGDSKLNNDIFIQQNNGMKRALQYPVNSQGVHEMEFDIVLRPRV